MSKFLELSAQAPQATTDLHRIALGLESGISDQCVYSLCCFDCCMVEGLVNPMKDEGLWNRCEIAVISLLQTSASGPVLIHALHSLSLSLQLSDPESDTVVPRLVDILMGSGQFSLRERQLALRCLSVVELDASETAAFQRSLLLILEFAPAAECDFLTLAVSLMCRYVSEFSPEAIDAVVIPHLLKRLKLARSGTRLAHACIGLIHLVLETRPDSVSQTNLIISSFIERLHTCGCSQACETCQGCLSCILRIGVHPTMRENLRPFMDVLISIAWNWQSGGQIAAQSLLNMMAGLLH